VRAGGSLGEENEDEAHQSKIFLFTSWFVVRYRLSGPLGKNLGPHLDLLRERGGVMFEQTLFIPGTLRGAGEQESRRAGDEKSVSVAK